MEFEWDEAKNQANIAKHGIAFAEAARIFEDLVLTEPDRRRHYGEERHLSIGRMAPNVSIVVAHTQRNRRVRLISARPASRRERQKYHEQLQEASRAR